MQKTVLACPLAKKIAQQAWKLAQRCLRIFLLCLYNVHCLHCSHCFHCYTAYTAYITSPRTLLALFKQLRRKKNFLCLHGFIAFWASEQKTVRSRWRVIPLRLDCYEYYWSICVAENWVVFFWQMSYPIVVSLKTYCLRAVFISFPKKKGMNKCSSIFVTQNENGWQPFVCLGKPIHWSWIF